ncbi:MAG: dockerin type I repeat-containing protein, partial [Acutalibacteraceae bacterium]
DIPKSDSNISDGGYMTANGNLLSSVSCLSTGKYTDYNSGYSFNVATGETAKIGFTAPTDGYYEISDELAALADSGAYYRVVLESTDGDRMLLQEARDVSAGDGKLVLLTKLSAGDTVYIEAWADTADAEINFGLPKAVKINNMTDGSYKSTPIDYYITKNNDGIEYNTSAMTQHQMTWQYKWFLNPVSVTDSTGTTVYTEEKYLNGEGITSTVNSSLASATAVDYDTLGIADLSAGEDGTKLINALRDYDFYYAGSNMAYMAKIATISGINTDGTVKYGNGAGTRNHTVNGFLSLATSSAAAAVSSADAVNLAYGFGYKRGIDNSQYYFYNMGVAFEWTAPASGTVDVSDMSRTNDGVLIVLLNNDVAATLHKENRNDAIDAITVEKGDVVTIAYGKTDGTFEGLRNRGIPSITFTPDVSNVTVKGDTVATELVGGLLANGTEITLPEYIKQGTLFRYWKIASDESAELLPGDAYTVANDDIFTAVFSYYGDLDENNDVNASDLTVLRKYLLGCETITDEILEIADVKSDGNIDLLDLIRMKKYLAGYAVVLGSE